MGILNINPRSSITENDGSGDNFKVCLYYQLINN